MKSLIKLWIISIASLCIAIPAWSADVTMRISLQLPLKSHLGQNLLLFKEEVESKSGGSIAVEIYDSAQLYKDKEVPAAVGSGSIEAGVASLTRYVGDIPAVDIFYQPFLFDTEAKVRKAVAKGSEIRGPIDEAIKDKNARQVTSETTFIGINSAEIKEHNQNKNMLEVSVEFVSEIISCIKDKDNKIVSGDAQKVKKVLDTWKFTKDSTSKNPNWLIVDTQA